MSDPWNPHDPTVFGVEWFPTEFFTEDVAGGSIWVQGLPSRAAETITSLKMDATANPSANGGLRTLVDIIPEGSEAPGPVQSIDLWTNADGALGSWNDESDNPTGLWESMQSGLFWPNPLNTEYIKPTVQDSAAHFSVDAARFLPGGIWENARICRVSIGAVAASITDPPTWLTLNFAIRHGGTDIYNPIGGHGTQQHIFGALLVMPFGELSPRTGMPWVPADIGAFDSVNGSGDWELRVRSPSFSNGFPAVYAFALRVHFIPVENRSAVGIWSRPATPPGSNLIEVETDDLLELPAGTSGWSKPDGVNHLYAWRQARAHYFHGGGAELSKDTRWIRARQNLGPTGNPPGISFLPSGFTAMRTTDDGFGLLLEDFDASNFKAAAVISPQTAGGPSVDSQPYRLTLVDVLTLSPSQKLGQRVTPTVDATYAGVRTVVSVPSSGGGTLRIAVHRISDDAQIGGTVEFTAADVRAQAPIASGSQTRYLEGFFTAPVDLVMGTDYEVRMTVSGSGWFGFVPWCGTAPEESFQGSTNGAFVGGTHVSDRDLAIALMIAPAPPQNVTAEVVDECVNTYACVTDVEHVRVGWEPGQPLLAGGFSRFELERQVLRDVADTPCEPLQPSMLATEGIADSDAITAAKGAFQPGSDLFTVIAEIRPDDWSPAGGAVIVSQWPDDGMDDSWHVGITAAGEPFLVFVPVDEYGSALMEETRTATAALSVPPDEWRFVRWRLDPDDGAGNNVTDFAVSTNGADWTDVGTEISDPGAVEVYPAITPLVVGGFGSEMFAGDTRQVLLTVGGTEVAHAEFMLQDPGTEAFTDSHGNVWNVRAEAEIVEDPSAPLLSPENEDCVWDRVAIASTEEAVSFLDREVPRGFAVRYRVRTAGEGGAFSTWVETDPVTPHAKDCEVIVTSNHIPDEEWEVVHDRQPQVDYEFLDHEGDEIVPIYGADYQVAFFETEDRGVSGEMVLWVNFKDLPRDRNGNPIGGKLVFEPLRRISRSPLLPYVTVLDFQGNIWRGHITLSRGVNEEPARRYVLNLTVIPTTDAMVPVEL